MSNTKKVVIREADIHDLPFIRQELAKRPEYEQVDLYHPHSITLVAEYDGVPITSMTARVVWQFEPLMNFNEDVPINARRRAAVMLEQEMENKLRDPEKNRVGVGWFFCHVLRPEVKKWLDKLKFHRVYPGGWLLAKDL